MNKLRFRTPYAVIARGVFCLFVLKNCPFYEKSTFFSKNSEKNLHMSKKCSTFAPDLEKEINLNGQELGVRP